MKSVGIRELKARTSEILRDVRERLEEIDVTSRGRTIARIVPAEPKADEQELDDWWAELDRISAEISEHWPEDVSALDAIREQRRDL